MTAKDIVKPASFDDDVLGSIQTFDDALELLRTVGAPVESVTEYGSGFVVMNDKAKLVNVPFIILEWAFHPSTKFEGEFVSLTIVTRNDEKLIVNDGSTGILAQLKRVTKIRLDNGIDPVSANRSLACVHGLTRSDYTTQDDKGKDIEATTFYLAD